MISGYAYQALWRLRRHGLSPTPSRAKAPSASGEVPVRDQTRADPQILEALVRRKADKEFPVKEFLPVELARAR